MENSDFRYLKDAHERVRAELEKVQRALADQDTAAARAALKKTREKFAQLEQYYLPMTEVRQLIYDADRVYYLGRATETAKKLRRAKTLLTRISQTGGEPVSSAALKVVVMIDELLETMVGEPTRVPTKLKTLGEKINLMAIKGDLILAGSKL
ncbi:hypothetical protein [Geothermobacter hydrogeniphilus]|uniref:Uncharacterized protein n=1 Tax=Geothermobacter hydrogeniphilus TaxID=1969733 RepID=A0A1X0XSH4_9BACT|nr:hypothetical protein [Geothermobacter hydrogeniphilus]ORJ55851.1 hypothetical protein B5V00_15045 [Geothermobacter hydrogeniphilus]